MQIEGSIALVTGANRGIGREFARELLERGATRVYAAARRPELIDIAGVTPVRLDITDAESVAEAARTASDVTLLINNAGVCTGANLVTGNLADVHREMDTHFFGNLSMVRAFAPVLAANGGGAVLNVLSALSWFAVDGANAYHAGKAAGWALSNGVRLELAQQGTLVTALHLGAADTDMMAGYTGDMLKPADVARIALDGVAAGEIEVLADDWSRHVKSAVTDPAAFYAGRFAQ
jgi:NAD(P)-dependent dehydrogenase (short-subunit alcohol dehydrogenase family)